MLQRIGLAQDEALGPLLPVRALVRVLDGHEQGVVVEPGAAGDAESLQGLAQIRQGSPSALVEAKRLLRQATALDAASSYAQSLLALAEFQTALAGWTRDPAGMLAETLSAAETAVALDEDDWLAHALRGIATLWVRRAYDKAILEEELALALNPSASIAYHFLACALTFDGQAAAAVPKLAAILDLDPDRSGRGAERHRRSAG